MVDEIQDGHVTSGCVAHDFVQKSRIGGWGPREVPWIFPEEDFWDSRPWNVVGVSTGEEEKKYQ